MCFSGKEVGLHEIKQMTSMLAHRGPDDVGYFISADKKVGLGHNRLSIIDLSKKGHQPMVYGERYVITFNGEIYNYLIQRRKLEREGYVFSSNSDTEVILALYSKYGTKCLTYLRGMFAFAIYDLRQQTLFLARDRIGKKPLKYYSDGNVFVFASELKAILTQKEVKAKIDYAALQLYLTYGYTPAPWTGFKGLNKLEPGSYIFISLKRRSIEKKKYWQPDFSQKLTLSESDWCGKILSVLEEAVKIRMIADVEVGAFLSGGVDSSGVVALMSALSTKPVKTFTITFGDKILDESPYARKVAKLYKCDHHELRAMPQSVEILPELAQHYEEPFADASAVVTYMISKLARKDIKVVLNGDGGDENFAGYPNRYLRLDRDVSWDNWLRLVGPFVSGIARGLYKVSKDKRVGRVNSFLTKAKLPLFERFASYSQIFTSQEIVENSLGELYGANQSIYTQAETCFADFAGSDLRDAGLKFDLEHFLPDQLLTKMDIATMAFGLEARSPFLDQEMIELACKIPFDLKIKNGETKYIQKKALESLVPLENIYRPKMGFTLPLDRWFAGELTSFGRGVLLSKKSKIKNLIKTDYMVSMLEDRNRTQDFGPRLWSLMFLELWLEAYFK